jgi:response regulator RpfG family c-di-GMP phosphodiesterase
LHDVGKLSLPRRIWSQGGRLDGSEWEEARWHPELGAALLAGTEGIPPLAVLVAYEHHLRFDGKPSYPQTTRHPNLASQITAVADSWDVMVEQAPPGDEARREAIAAWRGRAGTFLDPFLVGQMLAVMPA